MKKISIKQAIKRFHQEKGEAFHESESLARAITKIERTGCFPYK